MGDSAFLNFMWNFGGNCFGHKIHIFIAKFGQNSGGFTGFINASLIIEIIFFPSQMSSFVQNFPFSYFPYILFQIISLLAWQEASADELEAISWSFEFNFNFTNSPRLDQTLDSLLSLVELPPKMDFTLK